MSVAIFAFISTFIAAGQFQIHRDVLVAADNLRPDCLDIRPFLDVLALGPSRTRPYARAVKGNDSYAWSFRAREF